MNPTRKQLNALWEKIKMRSLMTHVAQSRELDLKLCKWLLN